MEQIIIEALKGNLDGATLLMLFIIGILTKRFVPWWVHEEALAELEKYESAAEPLTKSIDSLIDELRARNFESEKIDQAELTRRRIPRRTRNEDNPRVRPRRRRDQHYE